MTVKQVGRGVAIVGLSALGVAAFMANAPFTGVVASFVAGWLLADFVTKG